MNQVSLIGRITRDPELKTSSNGKPFVAFTLAISEFSNGNQYTQFVPCFVWDKSAENLNKYVKKGAQLGVSGNLNVRQSNTNGEMRTIMTVNVQRVEFLGGSNGGSQSSNSKSNYSNSNNAQSNSNDFDFAQQPQNGNEIDIDADAILFED
jgi:single-strand DNA-binding protein